MPETIGLPCSHRKSEVINHRRSQSLWIKWVFANAVGEVVGLGVAAVVGVTFAWTLERMMGVFAGLTLVGVMILVGTFEGAVVGAAQWLVLRHPIQKMRWQAWVLATASGAFVAWTLGMTPSTLMDFGAAADTPVPAIDGMAMYGLAGLIGLVLGPILGIPQWLVLRRPLRETGWWVPANALAWGFGMPVVFVGASLVPPGGFSLNLVAIGIITSAAAGVVVGAIHGLVLVWLLRSKYTELQSV